MRATGLLLATWLCACAQPVAVQTPIEPVLPEPQPLAEAQPLAEPQSLPLAAAQPAPGPYPLPPGAQRPVDEPPPARVTVARDTAQVGRLRDGGLVAQFDFEVDAGEHTLFELTVWGYTRGWTSTSALVVRDAAGTELARSERSGGTLYEDVLPFTAPSSGAYTLELVALKSGLRYLIVRHAGFASRAAGERFRVGDAGVVHEWLANRADSVTFQVEGTPGERIVLRAEPKRRHISLLGRTLRRQNIEVEAGFLGRQSSGQGGEAVPSYDSQLLDLELELDETLRLAGRGHVAVVRVPERGLFDVLVRCSNVGPPGLFALTIERSVEFAEVEVRVGDADDDPVAGAEVALFLEPVVDLIGLVTTDAEGLARVEVPVGDYTLVARAPGGRASTLRTRIVGGALNLVVDVPDSSTRD